MKKSQLKQIIKECILESMMDRIDANVGDFYLAKDGRPYGGVITKVNPNGSFTMRGTGGKDWQYDAVDVTFSTGYEKVSPEEYEAKVNSGGFKKSVGVHENFNMDDPQPPHGWDLGFQSPYKLQQGEKPFQVGGKWYLYLWDGKKNDNVVYDYSSDMFIPYDEFQQNYLKESKKRKRKPKSAVEMTHHYKPHHRK
jgi:hypothetical protein